MTPFEMLEEFHKVYNAATNEPFSKELIDLRMNLIHEEVHEVQNELYPIKFEDGIGVGYLDPDPAKLTKELADLLYVTIGTATAFGLPLEAAFAEVHRSNMSKLDEDGKPIYREDGKVLKGPNYSPANMEQFFEDR